MAKAEYLADFRYYADPSFNFSGKGTEDGNYFAGRIKGGLQFVLQDIILEIAAGYRIANAGEIKGDYTIYGITYKDFKLTDMNDNPIEFDYSGFFLTGGISIVIQ